ncbi:hypothetical protein A0H81_02582 [Grifola frondosa]|uniref:Uncharacterized protein n=1 Tax=Grifola frondosa TaxID=5627 RepID=A0A1C7MM06_GRIFR|nr:hypothetical protein A0H81_02582 [Grifola frondosa]
MRIIWQTCFILLLMMHAVLGAASGNNTDLICRPFGTCEPCPEDALFLTSITMPDDKPSPSPSNQGEIPAWESCGRIVEKERADFYEFLVCNFFVAILAVVVLFARSKRLQALQARQLAARIGLIRGTPGGWVNG